MDKVFPFLRYFLFGKYIAGTLAKVVLWRYNPFGIQPIDQIKKIPDSIPVVLVYCPEDEVVPANQSRRLYAKSRERNSHNNRYIIEGGVSHDTFRFTEMECAARIAINKSDGNEHNRRSPASKNCGSDVMDSKKYQPTLEEIEKKGINSDKLRHKIGRVVTTAAIATALLYKFKPEYFKKEFLYSLQNSVNEFIKTGVLKR